MMSATIGWRASIVALAIASMAGGCMCSGICEPETRLTASVYPATVKKDGNGSPPCDPTTELDGKIKNHIIVALITDKMQLASVNLPRLLKSSQTPVNFDFMPFFNWSDKDKFVTRSNIVIAPVKLGIDATESKKGVILYPDRDPNGMLYIQLVLIEKCKPKQCTDKEIQARTCEPKECKPESNDWLKGLASKNALNGNPDGRSRLWPLWNDLSAQSDFTTAILSNVEDDKIVSWNTFSFFEEQEDYYGFSNDEDPRQWFPLPINGSSKDDSPTLCLEVSAWNRAPS